jgi:hypothetical protein
LCNVGNFLHTFRPPPCLSKLAASPGTPPERSRNARRGGSVRSGGLTTSVFVLKTEQVPGTEGTEAVPLHPRVAQDGKPVGVTFSGRPVARTRDGGKTVGVISTASRPIPETCGDPLRRGVSRRRRSGGAIRGKRIIKRKRLLYTFRKIESGSFNKILPRPATPYTFWRRDGDFPGLRTSGIVISPPLPAATFLYPTLFHFPEDAAVDEADRIDPQRGEDMWGTGRVYHRLRGRGKPARRKATTFLAGARRPAN